MTTKQTTVVDNRGRACPALVITCPQCGYDAFNIFDVYGHNHLQCAGCNTTFCQQAGECSLEKKEAHHV